MSAPSVAPVRATAGVWHRSPRTATHDCRSDLKATCAWCGTEWRLCRPTYAEVARQQDGRWVCCLGVVS